MQCRYRERIVKAGDMKFGIVTAEFRKNGKRRGKFRPTSDAMAEYNKWKAENRLTWLIHANFTKKDYAVALTYSDGCYPESEDRFEKDARNYIARLRRIYKKAGADFKWVLIRAYSDTGRPHLHLIVSGGVDRALVESAWGFGRTNADRLQFNACGVVDLARYLYGQRNAGQRRWSGSQNLVQPAERTNVNTYAKRDMEWLEACGNPHKFFADRYPGYWLSEFPELKKNPYNGSWRLVFTLYQPDSDNLEHYVRKGRKK
jgi:hypothetical protein